MAHVLIIHEVEDYATWLRIATDVKIHILSEPLTNYRISDDSIRSSDLVDPRIHAFSDFLMWAQELPSRKSSKLKKCQRRIIKQIAEQYGN